MLVDARSLDAGVPIEVDLCIVGAGAAGITIAREFIDDGASVLLLEGGGLAARPESQALYQGEVSGSDYHGLDRCRLRFFGGTTNHWGGTCRPLDAIDFEPRDWVAGSGWPISREQLLPYYERAQRVCQLGPLAYELEDWSELSRGALALNAPRIASRLFQYSPPTRFGVQYRRALWRAPRLQVLLNANAVALHTAAERVEWLEFVSIERTRHRVHAERFVLALGGIENPRLLLASGSERGVGNEHDLVGRYFMDHPYVIPAAVVAPTGAFSSDLYQRMQVRGTALSAFLTATPELQRSEGLLNFGMSLIPRGRAAATQSLGQVALELSRGEWPDELAAKLADILANLDDVAADYYRELNDESAFHMMHWMETTPNPDNRVTLQESRDRLGVPRPHLEWRISAEDIATMRRAYELVAGELGAAGAGRMRIDFQADATDWGDSLGWGCHHIGTTRMHDDPAQGVVDRHCKVHGVDNLYVGGSSVFPTAGASNPTLTIVALALRLADHLKGSPT